MKGCRRPEARVVVVDDEPVNVHLLQRILARAGYENVHGYTDPGVALVAVAENGADLVVLDLHMPRLGGLEVLSRLRDREDPTAVPTPILVLTADASSEPRQRALASGADDYVTKPFDQAEALLRIANLLETRFLALELREQQERLEAAAQQQIRELSLFRDVLDEMQDAVVIQTHDTGRVLYANRAAGALLNAGSNGHAGDSSAIRLLPAREEPRDGIVAPALTAPGPGASSSGAADLEASGPAPRSAVVALPRLGDGTKAAPPTSVNGNLVPVDVTVQLVRTGQGEPVVVSIVRREIGGPVRSGNEVQ